MKKFFNLAHILRVFFGAAQLLTILSGVVFLFSLTRATNKAKAVRFSTLEALCRELKCQPGDLLEFVEKE